MTEISEGNLVASLQEVLAAVPETIVQIDDDFRVRSANRTESPMFRRPPATGDRLEEVFRGRTVGPIALLIDQAQRQGTADAEIDTGAEVYRVTARRLESAPWTMLVLEDRTDLRVAEQALADLVRDRSSVLASVSNELRTTLTAVLGYANLLAEPEPGLDEGVRTAMVQDMTDQAWDLAGIVEDLLAVARTEIGELRLATVPVNLTANTAQVIESMGGRGRDVQVEGDPSVTGLGDPARFRQIVRNLLSNALTHGNSPVRVRITGDDDMATLIVSDQGPGVPDPRVGSVFDQRLVGRDDDNAGRVGIGLWISRELTNLMGGEIDYRREAGETLFRVAIPRHIRQP